MKSIAISTAIILVLGLGGSLVYRAFNAPAAGIAALTARPAANPTPFNPVG